jgi:inhibitor of KinA
MAGGAEPGLASSTILQDSWPPVPADGWRAVVPMGEGALLLQWGSGADRSQNRRIHRLADAVGAAADGNGGLLGTVAGFDTLLVEFDADRLTPDDVLCRIRWAAWATRPPAAPRRVEVPVCYGGAWGPDLEALARHAGLHPDTVVRLHANRPYQVYCLGFQAGFPYAGPLPDVLVMPRRDRPVARVAAGSVAVAGRQTGVYTRPGPGGWHVVGTTPLNLFDPAADPPTPYRPGDELWFRPVSPEEFGMLAEAGGA